VQRTPELIVYKHLVCFDSPDVPRQSRYDFYYFKLPVEVLVIRRHELHKIIADEQPYTFLYVGKWTAVLDKRVVIKDFDEDGNMLYKKIKPTKTGSYTFHFNKWIKVPNMPEMTTEGW